MEVLFFRISVCPFLYAHHVKMSDEIALILISVRLLNAKLRGHWLSHSVSICVVYSTVEVRANTLPLPANHVCGFARGL